MKKILFVDDDELVLEGLQRMLRSMRLEWEMRFVNSGQRALEEMSADPADVVVADMRMPQMNGAQLLNEVMKRHPRTVRLILSGHADQDLIMKCVGSTHQYLSKPCNTEDLKTAISRGIAIESSFRNENLQTLISSIDRLPSIPALYIKILETLQSPDVSMEEVGAVVEQDIGMSSKILKLINSSFFGLRRKISTPAEAVAYIGVDVLKSIVLSLHIFSKYESVDVKGFSIETLWHHSVITSISAKMIAQFESAPQHIINESFNSGILHDTGKLLLVTHFSDQYNQAVELAQKQKISLLKAETVVFGSTHADVGGYLLGLWGLPVPVVEAIALHHTPGKCSSRDFGPLTAVHMASFFAVEKFPIQDGLLPSSLDSDYLNQVKSKGNPTQWKRMLEKHFSEEGSL